MSTTKPAGTPSFIAVTIDCNDLEGMTRFWGELLGVETQIHDHFGFLAHQEDRRVTMWIQKVPEPRTEKNRLHLDFAVVDLEAALNKVRSLGGSVGTSQSWRDFEWVTCADPEGNVFDIMQAQVQDPTSTDDNNE